MIYTNKYESPLGSILLAGDEEGLTGLWFTEGSRYTGSGLRKDAVRREMDYFDRTKEWLDIYFSGRDPGFLPRIHLTGTEFRKCTAEILCEIPFGKTVTYGWISVRIAKERGLERMSARAAGGAAGHNPISLIIPCHRVVGANGSLTGYSGGIMRKKALLELEGVDTSGYTIPKTYTACSAGQTEEIKRMLL